MTAQLPPAAPHNPRRSLLLDAVLDDARYGAFLDVIPDLILWVARDGTYLDVKPATDCRAQTCDTVLPGRELIGQREVDVLPPELAERRADYRQTALETGETQLCEYSIMRADGIHHEEARIVPIGPDTVVMIVRDVTDRKRIEQRLSLQYAITQLLADSPSLKAATPQLLQAICQTVEWDMGELWIVDPTARALRWLDYWASAALDLSEWARLGLERLVPHHTFGLGVGLPGEVWATQQPAWINDVTINAHFRRPDAAIAAGLHCAFGFPILSDTQCLGVILLFSRSIQQPNDRLMQMMAAIGSQMGQFITRKQAQAALQRSDSLLEAQQAAMLDGMLVLDERRQITRYNPQFCRLWQIPSDRLPPPTTPELYPRDSQPILAWMGAQMQDSAAFFSDLDDLYRHPTAVSHREITLSVGQVLESYSAPVLSPTGELYGRIWYFRDISHRKHTEAALARQNVALEQARQEAERLSCLKSTVLATISHEIRTPMNAVLGMADLLLDTPLDFTQRDFVETLYSSGETLLSLINQVLDFSKLEAGEMGLERLDFDLNLCIEEVADLLAATAHARRLELATLVYRNLPTQLRGDVGRLRQVLINLTSNAIKFTPDGEVVIQATLQSATATTATITLSVTDTGIGIPLAAQATLFEPFSQVDATTTRQSGGTGLGLAISKQLVELMGGTIGVESVVGQGSRFWVTLPFARSDEAACAPAATPALANADRSAVKVLIVHEQHTYRQILRYQLSAWQIQSDEAADGPTALQQLRHQAAAATPYDIVILDGQMRTLDSEMLVRQIQADAAIAPVRLILMTARHAPRGPERAAPLEGVAYLAKPIKPARLYDCLITVLGRTAVGDGMGRDRSAQIAQRERQRQGAQFRLPPLKLLLVEDDPTNQKVIRQQLKQLGGTADVVANGQAAIAGLRQTAYDVILMDCQMPIMDGYQATQHIRQQVQNHPGSHGPIIIALTANAFKEDRDRCLAAGMDDYMSKPILKSALAEKLIYWSQILQERAHHAAVPPLALPLPPLESWINWNYLHQISEGSPEFQLELLHLFVTHTRPHIESLEAAIASANASQIEQEAHHIKGASANLGLTLMQIAAGELEQSASQALIPNAPRLLAQLYGGLESVQTYLVRRRPAVNWQESIGA